MITRMAMTTMMMFLFKRSKLSIQPYEIIGRNYVNWFRNLFLISKMISRSFPKFPLFINLKS